jgi:hypothetical protein
MVPCIRETGKEPDLGPKADQTTADNYKVRISAGGGEEEYLTTIQDLGIYGKDGGGGREVEWCMEPIYQSVKWPPPHNQIHICHASSAG